MPIASTLPQAAEPSTSARILAVLAIALAFTYCVLHGPMRAISSNDFAAPYIASLRLLHGQNPYTPNNFNQEWHARGADPANTVNDSGIRPIYPPTTLVLVAPATLLHWTAALQLLVWGSLLAYCALLWQLSHFIHGYASKIAFVSLSLCLSPLHTTLRTGNLSLPAFLLCGFAVLLLARNRQVPAGILLALGCGLKPTIGFVLLLLLLLWKTWKAAASFAATGAFVALIAQRLISHINPVWQLDFKSNLAYLFGEHGAACFLSDCELRYQLINLQVLFESFFHNSTAANLCAYSVAILLAAAWLALCLRNRQLQWFDVVAPLVLIQLLPLYQRSYSGILVLFVIFALFASTKAVSKTAIALLLWFFVPIEEILRLKIQPHLPSPVVHGFLWRDFLMPSENWAILLLTILFLARLRPSPSAGYPPAS